MDTNTSPKAFRIYAELVEDQINLQRQMCNLHKKKFFTRKSVVYAMFFYPCHGAERRVYDKK